MNSEKNENWSKVVEAIARQRWPETFEHPIKALAKAKQSSVIVATAHESETRNLLCPGVCRGHFEPIVVVKNVYGVAAEND